MVRTVAVVLHGRDPCHPYELQNRAVESNAFARFIWLEPANFGGIAPFILQQWRVLADSGIGYGETPGQYLKLLKVWFSTDGLL